MTRLPRLLVACLLALCLALPAHAQLSYDLTHDFIWTPAPTFPPSALEVTGRNFTHAFVQEPGHRVSAVNPPQGIVFDPFGKDFFGVGVTFLAPAFSGVFNQNRVTKVLNPASVIITPIGGGGVGIDAVSSVLPPISSARAESQLEVAPFSLITPITGFVHTEGFATPVGLARACSFSYSSVTIRAGRTVKGIIHWGPRISTTSFGNACDDVTKLADPIALEAFDPDTGEHLLSSLLGIEFTPKHGFSQLQWDSNAGFWQLNAAAPDSDTEFLIDLPGTYTDVQGRLHIVTDDGLVSFTEETGIFAGIPLPPVGTPAAFGIPLGAIDLEYTVPFGGPNVDVGLLLFGGSQSTAVPEPGAAALATLLLLAGGWRIRRRRQ